MGKSTISLVIFHSFLYVYQRVSLVGKSSPTWLMSEVVDVDLSQEIEAVRSVFFEWPPFAKAFWFLHVSYLVGGFKHVLFSIIYGIILPID